MQLLGRPPKASDHIECCSQPEREVEEDLQCVTASFLSLSPLVYPARSSHAHTVDPGCWGQQGTAALRTGFQPPQIGKPLYTLPWTAADHQPKAHLGVCVDLLWWRNINIKGCCQLHGYICLLKLICGIHTYSTVCYIQFQTNITQLFLICSDTKIYGTVGMSVGPPSSSKLKYLKNYRMDFH